VDVKSLIANKLASVGALGHAIKRAEMPVDEKHVAAVRSFEAGLQLERRQNYRKARDIFEKLVAAGPADVADRARVHLRACTERSGSSGPAPRTAGDYHVLGVAELNRRELDQAVEHLTKARKLQPKREEIRYALAAAHALRGDREQALEHLEAAITLRPQNRFQARHDTDFQPLAGDPRFASLVSFHEGEPGGYRSRL
jgi:tetratricopeptide (TPR) repeat protein